MKPLFRIILYVLPSVTAIIMGGIAGIIKTPGGKLLIGMAT